MGERDTRQSPPRYFGRVHGPVPLAAAFTTVLILFFLILGPFQFIKNRIIFIHMK